MKTTRMTVEGPAGKATLFRSETGEIVINVTRTSGHPREDSWVVSSRDGETQERFAARLQRTLDGYEGTAGDVADYLRAIQTFAD
jgi:hypothetical protein